MSKTVKIYLLSACVANSKLTNSGFVSGLMILRASFLSIKVCFSSTLYTASYEDCAYVVSLYSVGSVGEENIISTMYSTTKQKY